MHKVSGTNGGQRFLVTSSSRLIRYLRSASFHRSIYACTHSRLAVKPGFDPEISFIRPEMLLRLLMEILLSRLPFHVIVDRESNYGLLFFFFFFFLIIAMRFVSFFLLFVPRIGELFLLFPSFFFYSYDFETSKFLISLFPEYFFSNDLIRFYRINIYRTFSPNSPPCIKNHEYFTTILFPSLNLHKLAHARSTREIKIGINFSFDSFFFFFFFCANFPTLGDARH